MSRDDQVRDILSKAIADAASEIPSEEITATEMGGYIAAAGAPQPGGAAKIVADVIEGHFRDRWGHDAPVSRAEAELIASAVLERLAART